MTFLPDLSEVLKALYGAIRLMRGDRHGIRFFASTPEGAVRSFAAWGVTVPLWLVLAWPEDLTRLGVSPLQYALLGASQMLVTVLFFYLAVERLTRHLGCRRYFPLYVSAQNWCGVVVVLVLGLAQLAPFDSAILNWVLDVLTILFSWFITYAALRVTPLVAFGLCVLEILAQRMIQIMFVLFMSMTMTLMTGASP